MGGIWQAEMSEAQDFGNQQRREGEPGSRKKEEGWEQQEGEADD